MEQKKVAIYIRVSTLDQAREGYSLEVQERTLRKWCSERKYNVYDLYADRGRSGKDIEHRPDVQRLMCDAENKCFDIVIFWALSRFSRSVSDLYEAMEKFQKLNISMVSYTESFDTSSPMGRAMVGIVGIFAQLERELTGERVFVAMEERAAQGKRTCSEVLGYNIDGKDSLKINRNEAEYVNFCFENYLIYKNISQVTELAINNRYKGKRGKTPTPTSIRTILTRPIYAGYNSFSGKLYKGNHQPIVSVDTFNKVQNMLKRQGKIVGRNRVKNLITINKELREQNTDE